MFNFCKNIRTKLFFVLIALFIPLSSYCTDTENDPFESTNRNIFKFNNVLDDNFFKPVAKGWRKIPDIPRKPLSNLASTAQAPISLANAILQLNRESIGNILGKFLINMTFGLGGLWGRLTRRWKEEILHFSKITEEKNAENIYREFLGESIIVN